ncbi:MAG: hypothetical protein H0Z33_10315 [Bacillaceae bacterium]|nr:hypothetical protein [Bacillaceae bacterium]
MTDHRDSRRKEKESPLKKFRTSPDTVPYETEGNDIHTEEEPYFVEAPREIEVIRDEDTFERQ